MLTLSDIDLIEGETTCTMLEYAEAMQRAINSGVAWKMQGSYGRAAMDALESGACMLGRERCADCKLCAISSREAIIGFPAHGTQAKKAARVFMMEAVS